MTRVSIAVLALCLSGAVAQAKDVDVLYECGPAKTSERTKDPDPVVKISVLVGTDKEGFWVKNIAHTTRKGKTYYRGDQYTPFSKVDLAPQPRTSFWAGHRTDNPRYKMLGVFKLDADVDTATYSETLWLDNKEVYYGIAQCWLEGVVNRE